MMGETKPGHYDMDDSMALNIVAQPLREDRKKEKPVKRNRYEKRRRRAENKRRHEKELQQRRLEERQGKTQGEASDETEEQQNDTPAVVEKAAVRSKTETIEEAFPEDYPDPKPNDNDDRRNQQLPQDTEERARYLAEFHARPLELDRRSHAVRKVQETSDSQHLFAESTEWSNFDLHPRIVQAVSSSLGLAKPTLIQTRAIPAFLRGDAAAASSSFTKEISSMPTTKTKQSPPANNKATGQHNILLHSETGSGKTMAYLLPILQSLAVDAETQQMRQKANRVEYGTRCLILCPTRELAAQTFAMAERLCTNTFHWLVPGCLLGGAEGGSSRKSEKVRLRKGLAIVVATPGRLLDHLSKTEALLMSLKGKLEWVVLDEADRLLDMGLGEQVKQIMQRLIANHAGGSSSQHSWRSVLVSATVTQSVQQLATQTLVGGNDSWVWIKANSNEDKKRKTEERAKNQPQHDNELADSTPRQLAQYHMTVSAKWRLSALLALLVQRLKKQERTVVFFSTCASVDFHYALFTAMQSILDESAGDEESKEEGIFGKQCAIYKLHGSVPHSQRQNVLSNFLRSSSSSGKRQRADDAKKTKEAAILLATDVAARGLNLQDCDWTIQYDPPAEISDYVHRAGRVARAGRAGHSLLFLLPSERDFLSVLKTRGVPKLSALSLSHTLNAAAKICESLTESGVERSGGGLGQGGGGSSSRIGEAFSSELQRRLEECVALDEARARAASREELKASKEQRQQKKKKQESAPDNLSEMARNAFLSHIRAYPTREKCVKHVFAAKALHLGHIARCFGLKEPPKRLASKNKETAAAAAQAASEKKRNAAMAFEVLQEGQTEDGGYNSDSSSEPTPKQSKGSKQKQQMGLDPKKARLMMMETAKRLQSQGMDA